MTTAGNVMLKPVDIVHANGSQETIYVKKSFKSNVMDHLPIIISAATVITLAVGIYINYLHLKKNSS